jgi:hypothetical protein
MRLLFVAILIFLFVTACAEPVEPKLEEKAVDLKPGTMQVCVGSDASKCQVVESTKQS